jgi:hypothetical protein
MRNVMMAAMLVAAGVSSNYIPQTGGSESIGDGGAKGKKPTLEENLPQPIDDPMDLLKEFLNPHYRATLASSQKEAARADKNDGTGTNCKASPEFKPEFNVPLNHSSAISLNLNFLIATLPDPERTHLGLNFDRILEAIINAAEDGGFSYDRYWLPWHTNHDPANPDPRKQDILDGRMETRHRKPGIIILRRKPRPLDNKDPKEDPHKAAATSLQESRNGALVIFLVGETPTAGINRHQFMKATDYIHSFKKCSYALGVLGPTFSGSSTSLRAALLKDFPDLLTQPQGALVVSGSASSLDALAGLGSSTIHSDAFLSSALEEFRSNQLRRSGEVAYLKEAATDFGTTPLDPFSGRGADRDIYYPREISRLRNVYPEQTNSAAAQVANLQQQLLLHLRDSRPGEDTLPQFSDQTPATQETILLQISETLRREHVGLVVVTGTDALDVMFLSRHLRELSPDVRLLIWDSDLLFVHGTDTLDFTGMLALSTYPLIPANHTWTNRRLPRSYFASNMTEGMYNACLALLTDPARSPYMLREYSSPKLSSQKAPSAEISATEVSATKPPEVERPPVWLSVIGDDAYWPLGMVNDMGSDPAMLGVPALGSSSLDPGRPTRVWGSIFYACSLLAFLYIGFYFYALRQDPKALPRWCSFLHPRPDGALLWRASYSFFVTLMLALAYLSFLIPVCRLVFANHHSEWVAMLIVGVLGFVAFLVALARGIVLLAPWMVLLAGASGCLASFATLYLINFRMGSFLDEESFFRALRSVQLGSGVGPDLPLFFLFLAFAWWASIQVQRARLVAEQRPEVPDIAANNAALNIGRMDKWLGQRFLYVDGSGWIVAGVGAFVASVVAIPHIISVDGVLFDAAVCALLILLSTVLFLTTYAFGRIWRALDRLLGALETQPIRFAFSNLPSDVSWSPLWQYGARKKTYTTLVRSLESLRALEDADPAYYPDLPANIRSLDADVKNILTPVNLGIEEQVADTDQTQTLLSEIAEKLSAVPRTQGWRTNHSESLDKLKKASGNTTVHKGIANWLLPGKPAELKITSAAEDSEPKDTPEMLAAEVIALRYLAYIRYVMRHLLNLLSFITTGFILMILALNCYPFQMLTLIRWYVTILFVLISAVLVYAFQEMSRNEILSRITDTKAGSLDGGFYTRVVSVGALPVLAVVASHFPSVGRFLFSWVQPAISALH